MANPNTSTRNLAKNPYKPVVGYDRWSEYDAQEVAAQLRAEGWQVKVTTRNLWRWGYSVNGNRRKESAGVEHNVWKRK